MIDDINSTTADIVRKVNSMKSRGTKVVSLAVGDPDLPTPEGIIDKAYSSLRKGMTHYSPSLGIESFRVTAAKKIKQKNKIWAEASNVVFISSKHSIYSTLIAIGERGNEVLIPNPGYFYSQPVMIAGMKPIEYNLNEDFSVEVEELKNKINHKTAAIIVNSPSNPTGRIENKKILKELLEIATDRKCFVISDEAYEDIVYERENISIGSFEDRIDKVISVFSLSKSFAMTGWRAGYTVANEDIIRKIGKVLENTFTSYPAFIQEASSFALEHDNDYINNIRNIMKKRRDFVIERLSKIQSISVNSIEGTFYAFPRLNEINDTLDFATKFLESEKIAILPGEVFGSAGKGRIRISFSVSMDDISYGIDRLEEFLSAYGKREI